MYRNLQNYVQCVGQMCLKSTSVLVVGVGGLGCPLATYLAAAGIGQPRQLFKIIMFCSCLMYNILLLGVLGLLDYDAVEMSNLHRQILHSEGRVGAAKTDSAEIAITRFTTYQSRVNSVFCG